MWTTTREQQSTTRTQRLGNLSLNQKDLRQRFFKENWFNLGNLGLSENLEDNQDFELNISKNPKKKERSWEDSTLFQVKIMKSTSSENYKVVVISIKMAVSLDNYRERRLPENHCRKKKYVNSVQLSTRRATDREMQQRSRQRMVTAWAVYIGASCLWIWSCPHLSGC